MCVSVCGVGVVGVGGGRGVHWAITQFLGNRNKGSDFQGTKFYRIKSGSIWL